MNNNITKLLYKALKAYDIPITYRTIEQMLKTHPEYPSMQSISDALDSWKVKHIVLKLTLEKLRILDVPVISYLKRQKKTKEEYIWITKVTDTKVHFRNAPGKEIIEDRDSFEEKWSGIVLAIKDITDAEEPGYKKMRKREIRESLLKYAFACGFIVLFTTLAFFSWLHDDVLSLLTKLLLLFVNMAGCYLSYTLIRQEKNQSNALVSKFCIAGAHIDCHQVTKSRYSKLFGLISWAEFGMAYFCAVILWLAVAPLSAHWIQPLWWLMLISLPFTVWSLFTQAFLIRKWCLFCCVIVLLLWINAGILSFWIPFTGILPLVESALFALLILICTAAVMYVCKTNAPNDPYSEQRETARIKYNVQTIQSHLSESKHETANIGLVWGNPQARYEITTYVSIACSSCGAAIKELRRLINIYPDFSYRIIFAVNSNDFENKANTITRHFIILSKTMDKNEFFDMFDSWYDMPKKSLETLQETFPVPSIQDCRTEIEAFYQFSRQTKISYTPAILINGQLLSKLYSYQDLYGIVRCLNAEE